MRNRTTHPFISLRAPELTAFDRVAFTRRFPARGGVSVPAQKFRVGGHILRPLAPGEEISYDTGGNSHLVAIIATDLSMAIATPIKFQQQLTVLE